MVRTMGLTHIALQVVDVDRAVRFYGAVFGAKVTYADDDHVEVQTPGAKDFIAFERVARSGAKAGARKGGVAHFGFRLKDAKDIGRAVEEVRAAGGRILRRGEFSPGHPYVFFRDPDGYEVEVWYE